MEQHDFSISVAQLLLLILISSLLTPAGKLDPSVDDLSAGLAE